MFFVVFKVDIIVTVLQAVTGYPLAEIVSPLRRYTCNHGDLISQVHLEPLIDVVGGSYPAPYSSL